MAFLWLLNGERNASTFAGLKAPPAPEAAVEAGGKT